MPSKAKELSNNPLHRPAYRAPDMKGRVTHSDVWARALDRWKPGMRVTVTFDT